MKSAFHLLRYVDKDTVIHRADPRTKVATITAMAVCLMFRPGWVTLAVLWSLGITAFILARLPLGTLPRFPKIVYWAMILSFVLAAPRGEDPTVSIGGTQLELGGILLQTRFTLVTLGLLFLSLLLGWTTSPGELPGAVHFLLAPFRLLRLPVDDIVAGVALAVRIMPLLIDELSTTIRLWRARDKAARAAKRSRAAPIGATPQGPEPPDTVQQMLSDAVNVAASSASSAVRRSREIGEALQSKGSTKAAVTPASWGPADVIIGVIVGVAVVALLWTS